MTRLLKNFIISASIILTSIPAQGCLWTSPERWYMFEFDNPTFSEHFSAENLNFWSNYCHTEQPLYWVNIPDLKKAAEEKHDVHMLEYLSELEKYTAIAGELTRDSWDYPTADELAKRRSSLQSILATCREHIAGPEATRWLLLEMRVNMLLGRYTDNIALWDKRGKNAPDGYVKEMMRNIYANALLNTGRKVEAWNIYSTQNDTQSLLWSVRKFTNLAGIKSLYRQYPDAPVQAYLLRQYINSIQDIVDIHYDYMHRQAEYDENRDGNYVDSEVKSYWEGVIGDAYARIDRNYLAELRGFVAFADTVAHEGKTPDPCMWESAAALCAYFTGDYQKAKTLITAAMDMHGTPEIRKMARRIRMLIACSADDVNSPEFKRYITTELAWLDADIANTKSRVADNARDRILNLGLTKNYEATGQKELAALTALARDYSSANKDFVITIMTSEIYPESSTEIIGLFNSLENPGTDPIKRYAASKIVLPDDFKNDITGTKLLQEGKWSEALPYLRNVSLPYLEKQAIAFYAARRDFKIPAWNGFQSVGDNNYEETQKPQSLAGNAKIDFCNYMLELDSLAGNASGVEKDRIDLQRAEALYQASRLGQCWYLSQYGYSHYEPKTVKNDELAGLAIGLLRDCSKSADPTVRASALFGLVYSAPDQWLTTDYDWNGSEYVSNRTVHRNSHQYGILRELTDLMNTNPAARQPQIVRCDVIRTFQNSRH